MTGCPPRGVVKLFSDSVVLDIKLQCERHGRFVADTEQKPLEIIAAGKILVAVLSPCVRRHFNPHEPTPIKLTVLIKKIGSVRQAKEKKRGPAFAVAFLDPVGELL